MRTHVMPRCSHCGEILTTYGTTCGPECTEARSEYIKKTRGLAYQLTDALKCGGHITTNTQPATFQTVLQVLDSATVWRTHQ